jgi:predicted transcriptional regulator
MVCVIGQGHEMQVDDVRKIIQLLSSTEMTISEIAERMSCSKSTVIAINRRFQVRVYNGLRSRWVKVNNESA